MISSKKTQAIPRSEYIKRLLPIFHKKFILLLIYLKRNFPFYMDAIASLQELSVVAEISIVIINCNGKSTKCHVFNEHGTNLLIQRILKIELSIFQEFIQFFWEDSSFLRFTWKYFQVKMIPGILIITIVK